MKFRNLRCKHAVSEIITALLLIGIILTISVIFIPSALHSERNLLLNMSYSEEKQAQRFMEALAIIKSERYSTDLVLWVYNYGVVTNVSQLLIDSTPTPIVIMRDFNVSWQTIYIMNVSQWLDNWIPANMNLFSQNNATIRYYNTSGSLTIETSPTNSLSEFGYVNKILYGYVFTVNSTLKINSGIFLISLISDDRAFSSTLIFNSTAKTISILYNGTASKYQVSTLDNSRYNIIVNFSTNQIQFKISNLSNIKTYKIDIPYYKRNNGYYIYLAELASPSSVSSTTIYEFTINGINVNPLTKGTTILQGINAILIKDYGWARHSIILITSSGNVWRWSI